MSAPVLSVITVCYNSSSVLPATIDSLLIQTWTQFEYLVIDGASKDETGPLLDHTHTLFLEKEIPFRSISEPDKGIYDAMNKGVRMARGKWLLFLNAGDLLASPDTLEKIFSVPPQGQIIYGDTICIYQGRRRLYPALPLKNLKWEMAFCHQSVFVARRLLADHPYDISYRVCADHHFFLSMYLRGVSFDYRPCPVSIYEISGYSDQNKLLSHREKHRMQKELGVFRPSPRWLLRELKFYVKEGIKRLFGQKLTDKVRKSRLR